MHFRPKLFPNFSRQQDSRTCVYFYGNYPGSEFTNSIVSLPLFSSCFLGVCFDFPVQSSRSSLRHSWSPKSTERGSSRCFHLGHFCHTYPLSKLAFPQCNSMKSTSGHLVLLCHPPQAPLGETRRRAVIKHHKIIQRILVLSSVTFNASSICMVT